MLSYSYCHSISTAEIARIQQSILQSQGKQKKNNPGPDNVGDGTFIVTKKISRTSIQSLSFLSQCIQQNLVIAFNTVRINILFVTTCKIYIPYNKSTNGRYSWRFSSSSNKSTQGKTLYRGTSNVSTYIFKKSIKYLQTELPSPSRNSI